MGIEEIAYQNKDIVSKFLAENLKGKTFRVYGLDLPGIRDVRPTNLPTVKANELRIDNLFELEDGSIAIVDYESVYDEWDKVKYLNYLTGIANRYFTDKEACPVLRMIVIYTGDIRRNMVSCEYNIGAIRINIEAAFLSELDSDRVFLELTEKVEKNELLNDEELMKFMIFPLSYQKKEEKEKKLKEAVELAIKMRDREQQVFALAGLLAFTDKIIDQETAGRIRRAIEMTQVARIFEEEKREALKRAEEEKRHAVTQVTRIFEEEKREALKRAEEEKRQELEQIVMKMLRRGDAPEDIASIITGYSQDDVKAIRARMEF